MNAKDARKLGAAIRRHRKAAGLGRKELAIAAGVEPSTVLRLEEAAFREPRAETLQRIARGLGIAVEELFSIAGYTDGPADLPLYLRERVGLSEDQAARVERYVARIAKQPRKEQ
jgi:transcriptional regulator with XRE-family HTH domain